MPTASAPSATRSSIRSHLPSTPIPRGPVTEIARPLPCESARVERRPTDGRQPTPPDAPGLDDEAVVREFDVQRSSAILRLHHGVGGADRHSGRHAGGRRQPELRCVVALLQRRQRSERQGCRAGWPTSSGSRRHCGGLFVSGGNMANIVCFLAARTAYAARAGWDLRAKGLAAGEGGQAHHLHVRRNAHVDREGGGDLGVGDGKRFGGSRSDGGAAHADGWRGLERRRDRGRSSRRSPPVSRHRDRRIGEVDGGGGSAAGDRGSCVAREGLWFHVDGAYGAPAAHVPGVPRRRCAAFRRGETPSRSIPTSGSTRRSRAGCALVRDPEALPSGVLASPGRTTTSTSRALTTSTTDRRTRAVSVRLKVWLALKHVGARRLSSE